MMKHLSIIASGVWAALALLVVAPTLAGAAERRSVLESVGVNDEMTVIALVGDFGSGAPAITVDGQRVQLLTNDGTFIAARLKPGTKRGRHLVVVSRSDGRSGSLEAVLDPTAPPPAKGPPDRPAKPPVIEAGGFNDEGSVLSLSGHFGAGMPKVSLDGKKIQPLTNDGTTLAARVPAGLAPGKYLVMVKTADGRAGVLQVTLGN